MILFINNNNGFLFIETIIEAVVDLVSSVYKNLRTILPSGKNLIFGGINSTGLIYCRVCISRLHVKWSDLKYITHKHSICGIYNCIECGYKLTKINTDNRFHKIHLIGKRRGKHY